MSAYPDRVTEVENEPNIARMILTWKSLGYDPLIDHHRVYGVPEADADFEPSDDLLLAKSVYPRFVHHGLSTDGETWTYRIQAVSDAGRRGVPSRPHTASSTASVVFTGRKVVGVGEFDAKTFEFQFAPKDYAKIPPAYPNAEIDYVQGEDTPASGWPFLLPGPGDAWAGNKVYRVRWHFDLEAAAEDDHDLAVWLVDTTRLGGILQVNVNGTALEDFQLPAGGTRGSREGDATVPGTALVPSYHEQPVPSETLLAGENVIEFVLAQGGWVAWDAIGLFARS